MHSEPWIRAVVDSNGQTHELFVPGELFAKVLAQYITDFVGTKESAWPYFRVHSVYPVMTRR